MNFIGPLALNLFNPYLFVYNLFRLIELNEKDSNQA